MMHDLMQELACAVRQKNFDKADEVLTVIGARVGYERAISRGRYRAVHHEPTLLAEPNIVTIHDLPDRNGIIIETDIGVPHWKHP